MTELEFPKGQYHYRQYTELVVVFIGLLRFVFYLWFLFFFLEGSCSGFGCFVVFFWWGAIGCVLDFFGFNWFFIFVPGLSLVAASRPPGCTGFSSCGAWAQLLHRMWNLPRPGMEPMSLNWQAYSLPPDHQGSPDSIFKKRVSGLLSPTF